MAGEAGDGLSLNEARPDVNQPHGNDYSELQHIKKGMRIRLEKEHNCSAAVMAVDSSGGEHLKGSAKVYVGDYSAAWPTLRPDGATALDADDYGRLAHDTGTTPNRMAIYTASGWTLLGTVIGGEIVTKRIVTEDLKLSKVTVDPTNAADYGFVYTKIVGVAPDDITELFYIDSEGNSKQITSGGKLNIVAADIPADEINETKIRLQNNAYLTARNTADDGDVNLIKAGQNEAVDADVAILPDGVRTATNAAPAEATGVANKKYVDDKAASINHGFGDYAVVLADGTDTTNQEAATDGFVVVYKTGTGLGNNSTINGYIATDSATLTSSPTLIVQTEGNYDRDSVTFPVKKGNWWKVTASAGNVKVNWMPVGV